MALNLLSTGIPGLDEVLNGGLPEYSFNLLAGSPGCGKTTLVHQLTFANASVERPALYFTVVGEPPLKMLRYQQGMRFFDPSKIGTAIRFVDLSEQVLTGDLSLVLDKLVHEVQTTNPAIVVVDSFRTVVRSQSGSAAGPELPLFLQRLALYLTTWQVTSFLVGEYGESEVQDNPVFTVADGILWLTQNRERNAVVRKLEVTKMRGVEALPGLHTMRITSDGIRVFPRTSAIFADYQRPGSTARVGFGVPPLDEMLGGGLPRGDTTLIAGPPGAGKTVFSTHFLMDGIRAGEPGVLAVFEEHPQDYLARARQLGFDFASAIETGLLRVLYLRPLDLSADEIFYQIQAAVREIGASRLVIDSLNGVELALAPTFRDDFRESLYRLVGRLTACDLSVVLTVEVLLEPFRDLKFSMHTVSFLAQNILFLRYVEIEGRLRKMLSIVKMRRSQHSSQLREFEITPGGLRLLAPLTSYEGLLTGTARVRASRPRAGLTKREQRVLDAIAQAARSPEELAEQLSLTAHELEAALSRLVDLDYVVAALEGGRTIHRATDRSLEASDP